MTIRRRIAIWAAMTLMGGLVTAFPLTAMALVATPGLSVSQVAKTADGEIVGDTNPLFAGEVVEYTFTVANEGANDANDVELTFTASDGLDAGTLLSCDPETADCTLVEDFTEYASGTPIALGDVAAGTPEAPTLRKIVFRGTVAANTFPGDISNTVSLAWPAGTDPANNTDVVLETPVDTLADISVSQVAKNAAGKAITKTNKIRAGQVISYVATVKNAGPSIARNVKIKNTFDSDVTNRRSCIGTDCSSGSAFRSYQNSGLLSLGNLGVGSVKTVSFRGMLPSPITVAREITNVVSAKSYKVDAVGATSDADRADATSTITTTVYKARTAKGSATNNQSTNTSSNSSIDPGANTGVYYGRIGAPTYFQPQKRIKTVVVKKVVYQSGFGRSIPAAANASVVENATSTNVVPVATTSTIVRVPEEVWYLLPAGLLLIIWITYLVLEPYEDQFLASRLLQPAD